MAKAADVEAVVSVATATMWVSPDAAGPNDFAATGSRPDTLVWANGLSEDARKDLVSRVRTQLLLNEPVKILETQGDWVHVAAPAQPTAAQPDGITGWLPAAQFHSPTARRGKLLTVDATAAPLCDEPDGEVLIPRVIIGTRLTGLADRRRGWIPVAMPSSSGPSSSGPARTTTAWVRADDVVTAEADAPMLPKRILAVAERLIDIPHLLGGLSTAGIDAPGLVHLALRRLGAVTPRDVAGLAEHGTVVDGDPQPGDLAVLDRNGVPDVGLYAGDGRMLSVSPGALVGLESVGADADVLGFRRLS